MIRLAFRTLPVFAAIIGFAMSLAAFMNYSGVRAAYLELIRSRMTMLASDIGNDIASAHALGIRLSEQTTLAALLQRQSAADPLMRSIDVVSDEGSVLFSSRTDRVGSADSGVSDAGAFRQEQRIVNDFGAPVGTVVVRLDGAAIDTQVSALRSDILERAIPAGLVAVVAGCLICLLLLVRLHDRAERSALGGSGDDPIERAAAEVGRVAPETRA